jgi:hypothetical protein
VVSDQSGANHNGQLVNGPTWTSAGRYGKGLSLDGGTQYVRVASPGLPTGDLTWALWVYPRATQGFQTLMEAQGSTEAELELDLVDGRISIWSSGSERLNTSSSLPANAWTHVALTRQGSVLRIYLNGVADSSTGTDSRIFDFGSCPLLVGVDTDSGCNGDLNGYLNGVIDEVTVDNRALSAAEIQQVMASPGGGQGPDTTPPVRTSSQSSVTMPPGTTQTSISLATNEPASCRYSTTSGVSYASMSSVFSSTGGTSHTAGVSGLTDGTVRTHYVRCQDGAGNANPDDFPMTVTVGSVPSSPPVRTFYVAPNGNDQAPGTLGQPFRTVDRARQAVRLVNQQMTGDVQVFLRGGEYGLSSTVAFDRLDSGANGFDVIYTSYPGEQAVLHGGQRVTGWNPIGGGIYKANVGSLKFRQLYVNGTRAVRARTPNINQYYEVRSWDTSGRRIQVADDEIENWARLNQVEMVILGRGVNQSQFRVASFSLSGNSAWITPREPERTRIFQQVYPPKDNFRPFYFENAFELLDAPGEWYLNGDNGDVFYMPRPGENLATADVVVPRVETLLALNGTLSSPIHDIQFKNLTFAYSTWLRPNDEGFVGDQASVVFTQPLPSDQITSYPGHRHPAAVHVQSADDVVFERNVFVHLGSSGLNLYSGTHDAKVVGNFFGDISASGISIGLDLEGNPSDPRQISSGPVIRNNYLTRTGADYFQSVGIMAAYTDSAVIEHNELSDMPYSGITVGWGWADRDNAARNNMVRYNEIWDVLKKMADGGGIYTLSRQPGTFIAENYVHDIVRTPVQGGFNMSGVYLDEGSSFITVRDNVLQSTGDRGVFQNANGPNNFLTNNGTQSSSIKSFAGLEPAFENIREGGSPAPPPDTVPPVRSSGQPTGLLPAGTLQTNISLSTDEPAVCRYAGSPGVAYAAMPQAFSSSGGTLHSTTVANLVDGGIFVHYVRCRDSAGNANTDDFLITVSVAAAGIAAAPSISPNGGQFSGPVTVTLTTATPGATIRYTTNGTNPTATSTQYTSPLLITATTTVRAAAFKTGLNTSPVTAATFLVALPAPPTGLVSSFGFSEGAGPQTRDSANSANTGTLRNGVSWTPQGRYNSALAFDGQDDYVEVPSPDLPTGDFTWAVWLKSSGWDSFQAILTAGDNLRPEFAIDGSGRVLVVHSGGHQRLTGATSIPANVWTHVAVTRSGGVLRIYVNGQDNGTASTDPSVDQGSCAMLIGVDSDSGCGSALNGHFQGTLDEVRIYDRALTGPEIQAEMARP